jgi:hippurate hydrolase
MSTITATNLRDLIERELPELIAIRHDLHAHPELGYQEKRTSGVIRRELVQAGIAFAPDLAGGTGVMGHIPGKHDKAVGLRADIDALPITEQTGAVYCSTNPGTMHACGHDGHTTILIGASRVLSKLAQEKPTDSGPWALPRPASVMFQPAE